MGGLPWQGYLAIACLLLGAVLLVPALITQRLIAAMPQHGSCGARTPPSRNCAAASASSSVSLAAIIVSFSLMVAMAIMVHSFRDSFDRWLLQLLPADLQLRAPVGSDAALSPLLQQRIAALDGVGRVEFRRLQSIYLRADRPAVTLIARNIDAAHAADSLPLLAQHAGAAPPGLPSAWISEAVRDLYGYAPGQVLELPLGGRAQRFYVSWHLARLRALERCGRHPSGRLHCRHAVISPPPRLYLARGEL